MIRFLDLNRGMEETDDSEWQMQFAFYDTVADRLIVVHNRCVFHSLADLISAYVHDLTISTELGTRLLCMCPDWVRGIDEPRGTLEALDEMVADRD